MVILEIAQTPSLLKQMMKVCLQDDYKTESLQTSAQVVKQSPARPWASVSPATSQSPNRVSFLRM